MINIDYTATNFKYPSPTPIHGEPTNKLIKRLKPELCAKASSLNTDLGAGDHSYPGLVLLDVEYTRIFLTSTLFQCLNFSPTLAINTLVTAVQTVEARKTHDEQIRVYCECNNVEKVLLRHIRTTLDDQYIVHLVDYETGLIEDDIPTLLD